jgi:prepilin-type processing-associated H-X9-DG protein
VGDGILSPYGVFAPARMVSTSYAGCLGSFSVTALPVPSDGCQVIGQKVVQNNGCFNDLSPIGLSEVTDGLSQTFFFVEKSTTVLRELDVIDPDQYRNHGWYVSGNWGDTLATTFYPPNAYLRVALGSMTAVRDSASSLHPGGLHALMGDGSVRFVKDTIQTWPFDALTGAPLGTHMNTGGWYDSVPSPGVWQALSTRGSGEVVSGDW